MRAVRAPRVCAHTRHRVTLAATCRERERVNKEKGRAEVASAKAHKEKGDMEKQLAASRSEVRACPRWWRRAPFMRTVPAVCTHGPEGGGLGAEGARRRGQPVVLVMCLRCESIVCVCVRVRACVRHAGMGRRRRSWLRTLRKRRPTTNRSKLYVRLLTTRARTSFV